MNTIGFEDDPLHCRQDNNKKFATFFHANPNEEYFPYTKHKKNKICCNSNRSIFCCRLWFNDTYMNRLKLRLYEIKDISILKLDILTIIAWGSVFI